MVRNMIAYYEDWKSRVDDPKFKKYCDKQINRILGIEIKKEKKSKQIINRVFVKSLNKTFLNKQEASFALGKSENYVAHVLKGRFKDKFGIVELKS